MKVRNGFVSNSSSSSFIISAEDFPTVRSLAKHMIKKQIKENSYDDELDNTQRYEQLRNTMQQLNQQDLHQLYIQCREDIVHNQELFLASKYSRLDQLAKNLNTV